jgi:hypothetical protein
MKAIWKFNVSISKYANVPMVSVKTQSTINSYHYYWLSIY